ncbi:MAG: hypothetical protein ACKOUM_12665 [Sphingopyxis sp.]
MGELVTRCGFALPVIDVERLTIAYARLPSLVADMRAAALTAMLAGPVPPLSRAGWARAQAHFAGQMGDNGRVAESIRIIHFSGWAPHPDQARPARRGSATASLADALRPGGASAQIPSGD